MLNIPDVVYNCLVDYFALYGCSTSSVCQTSASIVQGSAIGPVSYVVNASDLWAATPGNELCKYADDTYIIIPAANEHSRSAELDHIQHWAKTNNLTLNRHKSTEIIVALSRRSKRAINLPSCLPDIERVTSLKILGVTITDKLFMSEHVRDVVLKCTQSLHVIRVLKINQGRRSHRIIGGHKRRLGVRWPKRSRGRAPVGGLGESPRSWSFFCETTHNIYVKIQQTTAAVTRVDILNDITSKIFGGPYHGCPPS